MSPPSKRSRTESTKTTLPDTDSSSPSTMDEQPLTASQNNQQATITMNDNHNDTSTLSTPTHPPTNNFGQFTLSQSPIQSTEETTRPHRTRQPTKKMLNID